MVKSVEFYSLVSEKSMILEFRDCKYRYFVTILSILLDSKRSLFTFQIKIDPIVSFFDEFLIKDLLSLKNEKVFSISAFENGKDRKVELNLFTLLCELLRYI